AGQLDEEGAQAPFPFQLGAPADHDGELGRHVEGRLQVTHRDAGRHARERRLDTALTIRPAHDDRVAGLVGGTGADGACLVHALIRNLDAETANLVAEETGDRLPVGPDLFGGAGFREEAGDGLHQERQYRLAEPPGTTRYLSPQ